METVPQICATTDSSMELNQIWLIHMHSRHSGMKHTITPSTLKENVRSTIRACSEYLSINLAPDQWEKGKLERTNTWWRLGMEITTSWNTHFLAMIDCGPHWFSIWQPM